MSFDWTEYLSLAETLSGTPVSGSRAGQEARQRAAVSRAYYAGLIPARNHLRDLDDIEIPLGPDPHLFIINDYRSHPDPRRRAIGLGLARLRTARTQCDYRDDVEDLPSLTRRSLVWAAQVIENLRSL